MSTTNNVESAVLGSQTLEAMGLREELEQSKQLQNERLPEELRDQTNQTKMNTIKNQKPEVAGSQISEAISLREELEQSKQLQDERVPEQLQQRTDLTTMALSNNQKLGPQISAVVGLREELEISKKLQDECVPEVLRKQTNLTKMSQMGDQKDEGLQKFEATMLREELVLSKQLQNECVPEVLQKQPNLTKMSQMGDQKEAGSQKFESAMLREELELSKQLQNERVPEELQQQTSLTKMPARNNGSQTSEAVTLRQELKQSEHFQIDRLPEVPSQQTYDALLLSKTLQGGNVVEHFENRGDGTDEEEKEEVQQVPQALAPTARRISDTPLPVPTVFVSVKEMDSTLPGGGANNNVPGAYRCRPGGHSSEAVYYRDDYAVVAGENGNTTSISDSGLHTTRTTSGFTGSLEAVPVSKDSPWEQTADILVNAEKLNPSAEKKMSLQAQRALRFGILAIFVLAVVALGVIIVLTQLMPTVEQQKGVVAVVDALDICGLNTTFGPTTKRVAFGIQDAIVNVIGPDLFVVNESYCHALHWITKYDPQQLTPNDSTLVQRFIVAHLYFSINSNKSLPSCSSPSNPMPEGCMWWRFFISQNEGVAWLSNTSECTWYGIACSPQHQIIGLDISLVSLEGTFPGGLRYLPFLQDFSCYENYLAGTLPNEFITLSHITEFRLNSNAFTGSIPIDWWTARRLRRFSVGSNQLTGIIPPSVGNLVDVKTFVVSSNSFSNVIPEEIGNMNSVAYFNGRKNILQGTFPRSSKSWNYLDYFDILGNYFTGPLPSPFSHTLGFLYMGDNKFTGTIPETIYSLPNLHYLELSSNRLSGTLSPSIGLLNTSGFRTLRLNNNYLNGTVPAEISTLTELSSVSLQDNDFTGSIPEQFCALQRGMYRGSVEADCSVDEETGLAEVNCPKSCCQICCDAKGERCNVIDDFFDDDNQFIIVLSDDDDQ